MVNYWYYCDGCWLDVVGQYVRKNVIMNERINELRLDAGMAQLKDDPRLVAIDRDGNIIDPMIGLEKFAELLIKECAGVAEISIPVNS
jgi:hypothetical protein